MQENLHILPNPVDKRQKHFVRLSFAGTNQWIVIRILCHSATVSLGDTHSSILPPSFFIFFYHFPFLCLLSQWFFSASAAGFFFSAVWGISLCPWSFHRNTKSTPFLSFCRHLSASSLHILLYFLECLKTDFSFPPVFLMKGKWKSIKMFFFPVIQPSFSEGLKKVQTFLNNQFVRCSC